MANSQSQDYELINQLAEEFAERYRRGDHPTLSEYTARHPQLAEEIRELFPALVAIERVEKIYRTPDSPVPPAPFLEQLGDYRILREVGRGGMGIVYEAEQVSLGRRVALKVLPKPLVLDERNQRRFEREARAAAKLHHTNIVPVFGVGEQDGIHYYVMQFIQGLGLDRVLDEIKQMRAAQDEVGNAPHSAGESCPFAPTNVDAAQMARSLMSGAFDRTAIGQCDPVENDPVENDPLKNDPGLSNSIASDPADRQLQVTAAWQLEPIGPAPAGTDSNHAPAAVQTEQFSGLAAPHSSAAPRAETATSRLMDTLSLSGSVDLPGQTGIVTNRNVKRRTYWQSIAHVGVQVAGALAYAHEQGVLHRDIKPGNLLLDVRGTVWVADFGLAKASDQQGLTETGDIMGTLRYMPPEAFTCATDSLGDVYALGLTLYELLALRPAFDDLDRHRLIKLVTTGEPPRLDKLNPQIPRDLVTIVHKAIEREPRQRYQTAQEFADDLSRFLADVPVKARRSGLFERGWRWCRRNQAVAGLLGAVAGLLLAVAVVAAVSAFRLNIEQQATQHQLELTKKAEREATTRLYGSLVDQARANRLSRRAGQRFKSLEVLAEASRMARDMSLPEAELLELRNQAIACLPLFDVRDNQTWEGWLPGSVAVDFDPAFERYARTDREGNVHIHKVIDGGEIWHLAGFGPRESWVYFSPDGRYLHHSHVGKLRLWGLAGANPVLLMERSSEVFAYRPDSEEVACHDTYGMLRRFNLPSGDETSQIQTGIVALGMAYHPEGRLLAISHKAGVQIRDLETGKLLKELVQPGGTAFIKWSPDGKTLATDRGDRVIQLWDGSSGKPTVPLTGHRNNGIGFSFNQTGDLLASSDWDGILRLWDPHTGEQLFQALSGFTFPRFGPNDARLAAFVPKDGRLGIVEVPQVRKFYRTLVRDPILKPGSYFSPSISPDGRLLAVGMADGVGLWSLASGKPLTFVPCGLSYCVLFEPSGALLVSGSASVMRWPIDIDAGAAGSVHIGTPEPLPLPGLSAQISLSRDGQVMAKAMYSTGALVWHRDSSQPPIALSPHGDTRGVAVSPDGRFVATGGHSLPNVKIWDAETGKLVQELILEGMNGVNFSPNGRWLVTTSGGTRIWSTDSWKKVHFIGGGQVAFSADGKIMAVENLAGAVRLINPETGAEYARLEDPHQDRAGQLCFSPDGSQLVTTNSDSGSIHVWNLRAIRAQLAEMGLDWDLPAYPPEVAASGSVR